jgi:hypothetical protein
LALDCVRQHTTCALREALRTEGAAANAAELVRRREAWGRSSPFVVSASFPQERVHLDDKPNLSNDCRCNRCRRRRNLGHLC